MMTYTGTHTNKKRRKRKKRSILLHIFLILILSLLILTVIGGGLAVFYVRSVIADAPALDTTAISPTQSASYICSQEGEKELKLTLPESNRDLVPIDSIPKDLQYAFVAIEDSRFYQHNGIDLQGIVRAAVIGITSGHFSEGASTITQQLLKNSIFTSWTSESSFRERLERKIQEQYLAIQLEKILTKDQIMEDYLNLINLGAGCYGVQAASYRYFGKDVSQLTLSECAVIAGITQNPSRYNPITNPEDNASRRSIVLQKMLEQHYISQSEYDEAVADDVYSRIQYHEDSTTDTSIYTYYQDALISQVIDDLMSDKGYTYKQAFKAVYTGGLRIWSAQDNTIQQICDEEFSNADNFPENTKIGIDYALSVQTSDGEVINYGNDDLRKYIRETSDSSFNLMYDTEEEARAGAAAFKEHILTDDLTLLGERVTLTPQPQASCVIIDQSTGYVTAIVGGRGTKEASLTLNRASDTTRQPGSTFKILSVYAPALDEGNMTLATVFDNDEYYYEDGTQVSNWDLGADSGPATIREAIVRSINVIAVKCLTQITPEVGYNYAKALGITTLTDSYDIGTEILSDKVQSLALGGLTIGVTNLDLCSAYACIADNGQYHAPKFYTKVTDQDGNMILDNTAPAGRTVLKESTAWLLTDAMKDVITDPEGTAYGKIDLGNMPTAGKSGTTSSYRDIWFAGYTPYYTCCVWGGYDNNEQLPDDGDISHTYNKVLWNSIMKRIHENLPVKDFTTPGNIVSAQICTETGLLASESCDSRREYFAAGTQPTRYCTEHEPAIVILDEGSSSSGANTASSGSDNNAEDPSGISSDGSSSGNGSSDDIVIFSSDEASIPDPGSSSDSSYENSGSASDNSYATSSSAANDSYEGSGSAAGDSNAASGSAANSYTDGSDTSLYDHPEPAPDSQTSADSAASSSDGSNDSDSYSDGSYSDDLYVDGSYVGSSYSDGSFGADSYSDNSYGDTSGLTQDQIEILDNIPEAH